MNINLTQLKLKDFCFSASFSCKCFKQVLNIVLNAINIFVDGFFTEILRYFTEISQFFPAAEFPDCSVLFIFYRNFL